MASSWSSVFQPQRTDGQNVPVPEGEFRPFDGTGLPHTQAQFDPRQQMPAMQPTPLASNLAQGGRLLTQEDTRQDTAPSGEPGAGVLPGIFASGGNPTVASQSSTAPRSTQSQYVGGVYTQGDATSSGAAQSSPMTPPYAAAGGPELFHMGTAPPTARQGPAQSTPIPPPPGFAQRGPQPQQPNFGAGNFGGFSPPPEASELHRMMAALTNASLVSSNMPY